LGENVLKEHCEKDFSNLNQESLEQNDFVKINDRVSFSEMIKLYSELALSLNSIELLDTYVLKKPILKTHLRVFEVPMCGGAQLTKRTNEIQSYFKKIKKSYFMILLMSLSIKQNSI
jgi:spore maturation protein CgeB